MRTTLNLLKFYGPIENDLMNNSQHFTMVASRFLAFLGHKLGIQDNSQILCAIAHANYIGPNAYLRSSKNLSDHKNDLRNNSHHHAMDVAHFMAF